MQNAQGMDETRIAQIGLGRILDGTDAGKDIAVGDHDAFGFAGGAGGEENLQRRFPGEACNRAGFFRGK